ncbi:Zinc finger protein 501-like protein [Mycena indigotica]|uniref:Zinc finger protein 501-like protein n=1 Tax=Mycena indigotica TaxID=2126181 RepID=A0A8H6SSD3_9AGAR|nr:Zinc finger protein 501-like protein [Mycena indigotica]KAF7304012.1 Zinc finger protein 501-like protein [Mycena indigotica]
MHAESVERLPATSRAMNRPIQEDGLILVPLTHAGAACPAVPMYDVTCETFMVTYPRLVIRIPPLSRFNAKVTLPIPPLHPSQCESVFPNDINPSREEVAPPVANTADTLKLREDLLTTPLSPLSSRSPSPPPSPTPKLPETTDSPLHQCSLCSKTFLRASALERHRRIHTGERPFVCEHCKYAFQQRYHLKRHLKTVHRRPPRVSNTRSTLTTLIPSETSVERGASPATIYSSPSPPPASNSPINDDPLDLPLPVAQLEVPPTPAASDPSMLPPELEVLSKSVVLDPPPPALSRKRQPIFMRRPETVLLPPRYCDLLQRKMAFHLAAMFPDRPPS